MALAPSLPTHADATRSLSLSFFEAVVLDALVRRGDREASVGHRQRPSQLMEQRARVGERLARRESYPAFGFHNLRYPRKSQQQQKDEVSVRRVSRTQAHIREPGRSFAN